MGLRKTSQTQQQSREQLQLRVTHRPAESKLLHRTRISHGHNHRLPGSHSQGRYTGLVPSSWPVWHAG